MNSKKVIRQKSALARLEATYEKFKAAKEDKKPWTTADGHYHKGRPYDAECARMAREIENLKNNISQGK